MAMIEGLQSRAPHRRYRLALSVGVLMALMAGVATWTIRNHAPTLSAASEAAFEEATGIQLVRITISGGGGILDLRYRVLDPDKAVIVHDKNKPPTIISESTGRSASQPWMPHHGGGEPKFAVTYYELIYNPEGVIKRGDRVTLVIGDAHLAHVIVQ